MEDLLLRCWMELFGRYNWKGARQLFDGLEAQYQVPLRFYHTFRGHISHCISELYSLRPKFPYPLLFSALGWSLFFHDSYYVFGAEDNEKKSAQNAVNAAIRLGVPFSAISSHPLIMSTADHLLVTGEENFAIRIMRDIDISILGAAPEVYDSIYSAIRQEYAQFPDEVFIPRRIKFLGEMIKKERRSIYLTVEFRKRYEKRARDNIAREIKRLQSVII